ncbi:MAG: FdtA/QdtA family cupin domain-containing protein [Victivallaceae bacterium]|nr:FdtA/QdtA family cupin domain-containing protein [Victivallaceae bacterium]
MARLISLPTFTDPRGSLIPVEWNKVAPFEAKRLFFIRNVPKGARRGGHAQREAFQLLVCAEGEVTVSVDDGKKNEVFVLKPDSRGLLLPPMVWAETYDFAPHTVLLVLTSVEYNPSEYIHDHREFEKITQKNACKFR